MDSVTAEENILDIFKELGNFEGASIGLIIGQVAGSKCFVVHVAPTPQQSKTDSLEKLADFDAGGLGDHGRYVTRMLLGGMSVVGIFVVSKNEVFSSAGIPVIRKLMQAVDDKMNEESCLDSQSPGKLFLLHYNQVKNEMTVKRFELGSLKNVQWSFKSSVNSWYGITSHVIVNECVMEVKTQDSFRENLKNLLDKVSVSLTDVDLYLNRERYDKAGILNTVFKKNPPLNNELEGKLFKTFREESSNKMVIKDCQEQVALSGAIPSMVYVHPNCTVADAENAVKQDILRTLAARFELHWHSLVDGSNGSYSELTRVHEPPRRVLIRPTGWKIRVADYLFRRESKKDCIQSCKELLDLDVTEAGVDDQFESFCDPNILESPWTPTEQLTSKKPIFLIAFVVLLLGFLLAKLSFLN